MATRAIVSPTIFKFRKFRFFFFSREEPRMHVHVYSPEGEAKYWLEPRIELAVDNGIRQQELKTIQKQIEAKEHELKTAWKKHFNR